jgi:prepilin-type N-terminal cleavage/methylation domain-containing protein
VKKHAPNRRSGFTLVEMLVAVALVCLMLAMFGEVFSIATKSMSKMKGVAENDQKARMLNILIRGDLSSRSYRQIHGEFGIRALASSDKTPSKSPLMASYARGYVYIAENNPNDQIDDMIQFTVDASNASNNFETPTFYGRALQFGSDNGPFSPPNDTSARDLLQHNPDQPVFDDQAGRYSTGALTSDQTGTSGYAEIAYFLRNGNLYRRQMLIRQPIDGTKSDDQPLRPDGTALIPNATVYTAGMIWNPSSPSNTDNPLSNGFGFANASFWGDFDYSATWSGGLRFVGVQSGALDNFNGRPMSMGQPQNRWGFAPGTSSVIPHSMEYTADQSYIGRFTQMETSDPGFSWPGSPGYGPDGVYYTGDDTCPLTASTTAVNANGFATINGNQFNGTRVSHDLLATNVHEFDIKVWDDWATNPITGMTGMFVDIGGTNASKYLTSQSVNYGNNNPNTAAGYNKNVYDTWTADASVDVAPFRNFDTGIDGQPGVAGIDDDKINGIDDAGEAGWPGSDDWHDMKAIAIHIRYYDVPTQSMRDLTILHSFVE